jgi:CBS domain containing-hemolysin-like protein
LRFSIESSKYKLDGMTSFIFALVLLALALGAVVIRKTYYYLPVRELKRQAEKNDPLASKLYAAVAYGSSLRSFLWIFIALTSAGGFVLFARIAPVWLSFIAVVALLWAAFSWLPASKITGFGARLTSIVTPTIVWLLNSLHPLLSRGAAVAEARYTAVAHTGIFERGDLLELIERQQKQTDSRVTVEELEIAKRALSFDSFRVGDILTPRKNIQTVLADDTVGPILIDELHQSEQDFVLVSETKKGAIVGTLKFQQLDLNSRGHVRNVMDPTVYYVHENDTLSEALHAFFVTNHPLFVVVNSFEEYLGIITVENMLKQLFGHLPGDEFDQYADLSAVAARHPRVKKTKKADQSDVNPDDPA